MIGLYTDLAWIGFIQFPSIKGHGITGRCFHFRHRRDNQLKAADKKWT